MNQEYYSKLSYRAEIDGLRAIAVISIILYHAKMVFFGKSFFEGGFIGVDIFFVISGYLITRIILSELQTRGSFSFLNFYERRARRILPMLFLVIFVSMPYAWTKLLPLDFVEYAESILASLFFSSNFFFYFSTTDYGSDSALLKPFLHTWSLGIEEQFYLIFPIITVLAFKFSRSNFLRVLVSLSLISLLFAELIEAMNSDLNFYLPFSRFWELAVGSILAYAELNYRSSIKGFGKNILPMLGIFFVLYSIFFFDEMMPHPSFYTLIPIIGVGLIIGFSSSDDLVGKILGSKPFVWVGLISYSAYLWHYPIFAFSRIGGRQLSN
jgi:peptidoglycan/LPS O-acetylase OafA/YrhL